MKPPRKTYEQALAEWVADEIEFNAGYKAVKLTRDQLWQISDRITRGNWYPFNGNFKIQVNGEYAAVFESIEGEPQACVMVANGLMERVTEFYKAGLIENFSPLLMAQLGSMDALYEVGITAAAQMKPGWEKVK